jgi:hypothetical protein
MVPMDCIKISFHPYTLIKYPISKKYDPLYKTFRSSIYKEDRLVCASPSKSIPFDEFTKIPIEECTIEPFVEGIMINVFYDEEWKIATKSNVGANCTFDSNRTFAELYEECKNSVGLSYDNLNKNLTYSFVIQHPDHQIVTPVTKATLTCVAMFHGTDELLADIFPPARFHFSSYEEASRIAQKGPCKGLIFKHKGVRSKVRNTEHHSIESLKENSPFPYRYLLLRCNLLKYKEYLSYFPKDEEKGIKIEASIQTLTMNLYSAYRNCFVLKKEKAKGHEWVSYLYDLHGIYIQELYPKHLSKKNVAEYINALSIKRQAHLLNFYTSNKKKEAE